MSNNAFIDDSASLAAHLLALHCFSRAASGIAVIAMRGAQAATTEADSSHESLHNEQLQAERDAAAAEAALLSCQADPESTCDRESQALDDARGRVERAERRCAIAYDCLQRLMKETMLFMREMSDFRFQLEEGIPVAANAVRAGMGAIAATHMQADGTLGDPAGPDVFPNPAWDLESPLVRGLTEALDEAFGMSDREFDRLSEVIEWLHGARERLDSTLKTARADWPGDGADEYEKREYAAILRACSNFECALRRLDTEIDAVSRDIPV